ncbi:MAG: ABC transporter ATP-binding protein [bacterium]
MNLECHNLEKALGSEENRVHALRGVSLQLEPGQVHAVVGPSGCGKSTLLYILGLLDRPDAGSLTINGQSTTGLSDRELSEKRNAWLGFIFQFHFLLQDFTALENVMIPMKCSGKFSTEEMINRGRELLAAVGLEEKAERPSHHLSGGEQQRVAIARAIANDPRVILADEPTGNLDSANSERVFNLMASLARERAKSLLIVTHNPIVAMRCDWVHRMKDGQIVDTKRNPHPHAAVQE